MKYIKRFNGLLVSVLTIIICLVSSISQLIGKTIIEGEFDRSVKIDSFSIVYTTNPVQENNIYSFGVERNIEVKNGKFVIQIDDASSLFYLQFLLPTIDYKNSGPAFEFFRNIPILFQADRLNQIFVSADSIACVGENQQLLNVQFELFQIYSNQNKRLNNATRLIPEKNSPLMQENIAKFLDENKTIYLDLERQIFHVLNTEYQQIPIEIRNQLLYDYLGRCRLDNLRMFNFKAKNPDYGNEIIEYYLKNYLDDIDSSIVAGYLGKSYLFTSYLAGKIRLDLKMSTSKIQKSLKFNLPIFLDLAYAKYSGLLYDQVAFSSFLNWKVSNNMNNDSYKMLLSTVQDPDLSQYILEDMQKTLRKEQSFQFHLKNDEGKYVSNQDLIGKVVLFDFWFTGCMGCINLHQKIQPVKAYFKDNPNVQFVSVNVDPHEDSWKKSIASGNYTDPGDLKLWTGEGNNTPPIIQHYNISSYPTLVLVDAKDELVMVNPPDPRTPKGLKELIFLIENTIEIKE